VDEYKLVKYIPDIIVSREQYVIMLLLVFLLDAASIAIAAGIITIRPNINRLVPNCSSESGGFASEYISMAAFISAHIAI
jgi:hypothetical protein